MKQFSYKCVVTKNGTKMYYKRVANKWQRISNKVGMKAEKGKKKYKENKNSPLCSIFQKLEPKEIKDKREIIHKALKKKYENINLLEEKDNVRYGVQFIKDMFELYDEHFFKPYYSVEWQQRTIQIIT